MGVLFGLLTAVSYGASDFCTGVAGRRVTPARSACMSQPFGLIAALIALAVVPSHPPTAGALAWGALAGAGSGTGVLALLHGLARGRMSVVAPLSGVLAAGLPALVGVATGDHLSTVTAAGLAVAVPAILLVAAEPGAGRALVASGVAAGVVAGAGFGLQFIALDRAGPASGAWPLLPAQSVAVLLAVVATLRGRPAAAGWRPGAAPAAAGGILAGLAALAYRAATGHGQLSVIAVLAALYPAATVLLARLVLRERWSRPQAAGLALSVVAVVAISAG